MNQCFYNTKTCDPKITKEHVISKIVLKECFGEKIRNTTEGEFLGDVILKDHEQVVKDVCKKCNESLSPYDIAGKILLKYLLNSKSKSLKIPFDNNTLNWLLKTHLNFFRVIKDRESNLAYPVKQKIKTAIVNNKKVPHELYHLLVQEWEDTGYYWEPKSPDKVSFFQYRSIRFRRQYIVLSSLRLRNLHTILMLPTDKKYNNFHSRIKSCLAETKIKYGYVFQPVNTKELLLNRVLKVENLFSKEDIERIKYKKVNKPFQRTRKA